MCANCDPKPKPATIGSCEPGDMQVGSKQGECNAATECSNALESPEKSPQDLQKSAVSVGQISPSGG